QVVTIGAWMWADQPARIAAPGLVVLNNREVGQTMRSTIQLGTNPQFFSWPITMPADLLPVSFVLNTRVLTESEQTVTARLFLDGVVVAPGRFPAGQPQFSDEDGTGGSWGGRPFANLVRNASFERRGPSLRPWVDRALLPYTKRHPAAVFFDLLDFRRAPAIIGQAIQRQSMTFFVFFGWVQFRPPGGMIWFDIIAGVVRVALIGCLVWLVRRWRAGDRPRRAAVIFLGLAALPVWLFSIMRTFPFFIGNLYFPIARYGFPAVVPALLAVTAGWYALAPRRWQPALVGGLVIAAATLDCLAMIGVARLIRG
ncbi:MAG TPA: hypothetical protein VD886_08115, partial [Herpetosiphonaceae bacterium]|nr:hypothetical protein [Herpetosiphonaceae bacterium]